jgi:hypothetical protein
MDQVPDADCGSQAVAVFVSVEPESEKKLAVMAAVGRMINTSRPDAAVYPWHGDTSVKIGLEAINGLEIFS